MRAVGNGKIRMRMMYIYVMHYSDELKLSDVLDPGWNEMIMINNN